jgi:hypothetical protein
MWQKQRNNSRLLSVQRYAWFKGPYEDHPDPLIALLGTLESNVTDLGERHDEYIGDALLAELWGDNNE